MKKIDIKSLDKNILLWIIGSVVCTFGDLFTSTAIPLYTYELTKSPQFTALVFAVDVIPVVILLPIIGTKIDFSNKKVILICANIFSSIVLLVLMLSPDNPWIYLVGNSLISISSLFYITTAKIILPEIVTNKDNLSRINSLISFSLKISRVLATSFAAFMLLKFTPKLLLLVDLCTFLTSAVTTAFIVFKNKKPLYKLDSKTSNINMKLSEGFNFLVKNSNFSIQSLYYSLLFFLEGILFSQIVVFIKHDLNLGNEYYGVFQNLFLVGVLVGQLILIKFKLKHLKINGIKVGIILATLSFLALAVSSKISVILLFGLCQPLIIITWYDKFYKEVPEELRARVLSICSSFFEIVRLCGIGAIFLVSNFITIRQEFIFASLGVLIICTILFIVEQKIIDKINKRDILSK